MTVKVTLAGISGDTEVEVGNEGTPVAEVLKNAAQELGFDKVDLSTLVPVINGEDADDDTVVRDGDHVTAAPAVQNGR